MADLLIALLFILLVLLLILFGHAIYEIVRLI